MSTCGPAGCVTPTPHWSSRVLECWEFRSAVPGIQHADFCVLIEQEGEGYQLRLFPTDESGRPAGADAVRFEGIPNEIVARRVLRAAVGWLITGARWPMTEGNPAEQRGWARDLLAACPPDRLPAPAQGEPVAGRAIPEVHP